MPLQIDPSAAAALDALSAELHLPRDQAASLAIRWLARALYLAANEPPRGHRRERRLRERRRRQPGRALAPALAAMIAASRTDIARGAVLSTAELRERLRRV
jgi:hypothetical protein